MPRQKKVTEFEKRIYFIVSKIPKGKVSTYKIVASIAGNPKAARAVGSVLNKNPFPPHLVPCHRVVKSNGAIGGYAKGVEEKIRLLTAEGVKVVKGKIDLNKYLIKEKDLRYAVKTVERG
ncbi:MAG: MGMT family protein [Candidatus Odinarchaeia archaeon]